MILILLILLILPRYIKLSNNTLYGCKVYTDIEIQGTVLYHYTIFYLNR